MTPDQIIKGQTVTRTNAPGNLGVLTGRVSKMGPITMVEVDWGGHREKHNMNALSIHAAEDDGDIRTLIARGKFGSVEDFQRRITYEKLQGTLTDLFYSMSVAQMDFYPHQFKPVLRFVDSPSNRLLIADEVGLGKTIEAGLIWTECRARFQARRLLVVCPPMLCNKWADELRTRFQLQDVRIVKPEDLSDLLDQFDRIGKQLSFHAVCSYNSLRPSQVDKEHLRPMAFDYVHQALVDKEALSPRGRLLSRIYGAEETSPFADLIVFDEAHVMKNTATATHMVGRILSASCPAVVCLSATPIHNKSRDLFALMQMVGPDFFEDEATYNFFCIANQPVIALLNLLERPDATKNQIMALVYQLSQSHFLRDSELFANAAKIAERYEPTATCRMELASHIEKLNIFDTYINRTRKRQMDVSGRVQRTAHKLSVRLSAQELNLYNAILGFLRQRAIYNSGEASIFHILNPALRMASCLPVMAGLLRQGRWGDETEIREIEEAFGEVDETDQDEDSPISNKDPSILDLLDVDYEAGDSKYAVFRDHLVRNTAGEKLIVFAFFKDTVAYLARRLQFDGFKCAVLTGAIMDMEERKQILYDFENSSYHKILLCSEVAAEGIDLQFCRTIVNYDLPWNPMRVEQRIGRVDRIGQAAKSISIVNFCIEDTIDGRIFNHLHTKLQIFKNSIGDLEEIIGHEINKLARSLLTDKLTPEQEERRISDAADAIIRSQKLERELEESSEGLVAYRDYLSENIGNSQRLGRFVKPSELKLYMDDFFSQNYRGSKLEWDHPSPQCGQLSLSSQAIFDMESFCNREHLAMPPILCSSRGSFHFTLFPDALKKHQRKHRGLALVNHMHPLIRWITSGLKATPRNLHPVARLSLASNSVPYGWYVFFVQRLTLNGLHKREKLIHGLARLPDGKVYATEIAETLLNQALDHGEKTFATPDHDPEPVFDELSGEMNQICGQMIQEYRVEMESKRRIKISQTEAYYNRRISAARQAVETIESRAAGHERGLALAHARLANLEKLFDQKRHELENSEDVSASHADVTAGILEVRSL
jgi:superfamily II DNA or RNA helicase